MTATADTIREALIRRKQVEARTGLARSTIYKLMSCGDFPAALNLTGRAVAWRATDVDSWIASRIANGTK
ncbi:MAG: DNA-binding protein [Comamonadaceae bacterium]|nr:DNA-binding protein [Comamonadaceae bacterium]